MDWSVGKARCTASAEHKQQPLPGALEGGGMGRTFQRPPSGRYLSEYFK